MTTATPFGHASLRPWILSGWICGATDMRSEGNEGFGFIEVNQSGGLRKAETKAKSRTEKQALINGFKPVWYVYKVGA